jgi:hypothetical protein
MKRLLLIFSVACQAFIQFALAFLKVERKRAAALSLGTRGARSNFENLCRHLTQYPYTQNHDKKTDGHDNE